MDVIGKSIRDSKTILPPESAQISFRCFQLIKNFMTRSHFLSAGATASRNSEKTIYETSELASEMYVEGPNSYSVY